jgi:PAS domain-containing protein
MAQSMPPVRTDPATSPSWHELDQGQWELHLWEGSAWFNDWFYRRLQWPMYPTRKIWKDLEPYVSPDAWNALMRGIRMHLELHQALETKFQIRRPDGRIEWWRLCGSAEFNALGQPVFISGSVRALD